MKRFFALCVGLFLTFGNPATAQDLHLSMMTAALEAVHSKYKKVALNPNPKPSRELEKDAIVLDAKKRILQHAHTFWYRTKKNGQTTLVPILDSMNNQIVPLKLDTLTANEIRDLVVAAIQGEEKKLLLGNYLRDAVGHTTNPQWAAVQPAQNDNQILVPIADALDQFRTDFDARAGTKEPSSQVFDAPQRVNGAKYVASTRSLLMRIEASYRRQFRAISQAARNNNAEVISKYQVKSQNRQFWNDTSLASELPNAIDAVTAAYSSAKAQAEIAQQTKPAGGGPRPKIVRNPTIPDNRKWQAFQKIVAAQIQSINDTQGQPGAVSGNQNTVEFVSDPMLYAVGDPKKFGLDKLDPMDKDVEDGT